VRDCGAERWPPVQRWRPGLGRRHLGLLIPQRLRSYEQRKNRPRQRPVARGSPGLAQRGRRRSSWRPRHPSGQLRYRSACFRGEAELDLTARLSDAPLARALRCWGLAAQLGRHRRTRLSPSCGAAQAAVLRPQMPRASIARRQGALRSDPPVRPAAAPDRAPCPPGAALRVPWPHPAGPTVRVGGKRRVHCWAARAAARSSSRKVRASAACGEARLWRPTCLRNSAWRCNFAHTKGRVSANGGEASPIGREPGSGAQGRYSPLSKRIGPSPRRIRFPHS